MIVRKGRRGLGDDIGPYPILQGDISNIRPGSFVQTPSGQRLNVGDTWTVSIAGATPGATVWREHWKDLESVPNHKIVAAGVVDSSGALTYRGTVDADQSGHSEHEVFSVGTSNSQGGWQVGGFTYSVVGPTPAPVTSGPVMPPYYPGNADPFATPAGVTPPKIVVPASSMGPTVVQSSGVPGSTGTMVLQAGGFSLSSIPWWAWALLAGGGLLLFNKGGR